MNALFGKGSNKKSNKSDEQDQQQQQKTSTSTGQDPPATVTTDLQQKSEEKPPIVEDGVKTTNTTATTTNTTTTTVVTGEVFNKVTDTETINKNTEKQTSFHNIDITKHTTNKPESENSPKLNEIKTKRASYSDTELLAKKELQNIEPKRQRSKTAKTSLRRSRTNRGMPTRRARSYQSLIRARRGQRRYYALPPTIGYFNHCLTFERRPMYSFGQRTRFGDYLSYADY